MTDRSIDGLWAVVLAAGRSSRFGKPKLLEPFRGQPMLCHALRAARRVVPGRVLLVTGHMSEEIASAAAGLYDETAYNGSFEDGIGTSISTGIRHCAARAEGVLLLLADQPMIDAAQIEKLVHRWAHCKAEIVVSEYNDTVGPPAIFARSTFGDLSSLKADKGAKDIIKSGRYEVAAIGDSIMNPDIDSPEDLSKLI